MNFYNSSGSSFEIDMVEIVGLNLHPSTAQPLPNLDHLQRQLETTRLLVQKVITPILVTFGVIGNIVNIAVLTRRWMKSSTNCYLTALAVYDVLYLLLALILSFNHYPSIRSSDWYITLRKPILLPLTDTCSNTGVWLTLTFTVERYIGVGHPMKGMVWCTPRVARIIVVVVCLSAALVTFPEFFDWTSEYRFDNSTNSTTIRSVQTAFGQSKGYAVVYKYINQALFTFLPLALLSIFNAMLVNAVVSAARWRQRMHETEKRDAAPAASTTHGGTSSGRGDRQHPQTQQRITIMLIIVVVVFLLCQTPQAVQNVLVAYLDMRGLLDDERRIVFTITANIFNLLVIANCCSNFILYSSFSSKFRLTFHKLFCASCTSRRNRATMQQLYSDGAVTTVPMTTARNDGRVDTIVVCDELWPSNDVTNSNGQTTTTTTASGKVATKVAIRLAKEMVKSFRAPVSD